MSVVYYQKLAIQPSKIPTHRPGLKRVKTGLLVMPWLELLCNLAHHLCPQEVTLVPWRNSVSRPCVLDRTLVPLRNQTLCLGAYNMSTDHSLRLAWNSSCPCTKVLSLVPLHPCARHTCALVQAHKIWVVNFFYFMRWGNTQQNSPSWLHEALTHIRERFHAYSISTKHLLLLSYYLR